MSGDTFRDQLDKAVELLAKEDPDGGNQICTNWILITEWADFEGTRYLQTKVSDSMTPWLAYGMISSAEEYNYDFDKQEEEEFDGEDED